MKNFVTLRRKVLLIVIPAMLVIAGVSAYSSIHSHQIVFDNCKQRELDLVFTVLNNDMQEQKNKAAARASIVAYMPSIQKAFRAGDRQLLMDTLLPVFQAQHDRFGVSEAQFHLPPAISYLRLDSPGEGYGEDVSDFREMVVVANKEHQPQKGVEVGRDGLSIRGVELLKDDQGYIGSFEVGLSLMTPLENLKKNTGFDAAVFVNEDMMSRIAINAPKPDAERIIAGFRNVEATDWQLLKPVLAPDLFGAMNEVKTEVRRIGGIEYGVVVRPLYDYRDSRIGSIIAVREFDNYRKQMQSAVVSAVAFALLQVLVMVGVVVVTINVLFVRPTAINQIKK